MCLSPHPLASKAIATPSMKTKKRRVVSFAAFESKVVGYTVSRFDLSQAEASSYWMTKAEFNHIHKRNKYLISASGSNEDHQRGIQMFEATISNAMTHLQGTTVDTASKAHTPLLECAATFEYWSQHFHLYRGLERGVAQRYRLGMDNERYYTRTGVMLMQEQGASDEDISKMYRSVADASRTIALLMGLGDAWAANYTTREDTGEDVPYRLPLETETANHGCSTDLKPTPTKAFDLELLSESEASVPPRSTLLTAVVID